MNQKRIKIIFGILIFLIVLFLLGFDKPEKENLNSAIIRYRYNWGLPFRKKKTIAIKDVSKVGGDTVTHIFNYFTGKAYQFLNGKYNYSMGLYDVE